MTHRVLGFGDEGAGSSERLAIGAVRSRSPYPVRAARNTLRIEYTVLRIPEDIVMAQTETRVLTAHVPLALADKVDRLALRLDRSCGWILEQALTAWIDQEDERSRV